ncbi:MAG: DUF1343 domain-containing protein [Chlorobiaceae bacterium]|nr:DUF1343 domain-containing protein [Chlorobiaceae bacterium]
MLTMECEDISIESLAYAMEVAAIVVDRPNEETLYLKEGVSFPLWLIPNTARNGSSFTPTASSRSAPTPTAFRVHR